MITNESNANRGEPTEVQRVPDPRTYARIIWRWKILFLAFVIIIPLATSLFERSQPRVYQASALMEVTGGPQTDVASLFNQVVQQGPDTTDLLADVHLLSTTRVAQQARTYLGPSPPSARSLLKSVNVSADQTTGLITLTGSAGTSSRAADIANAFARALIANQTQAAVSELTVAIRHLQGQMTTLAPNDPGRSQLLQQLARLRTLLAAQGSEAQIVQPAIAPLSPSAPKVTRSIILALIAALLLGLGAVAIAEADDRRIRHPDQIRDFAGLPLLSAIPASAFEGPPWTNEAAESFATLRAALTYFNVDRRISSVLVASPGKESGKTTVAIGLAQALARAGKQVILVDTDLRRPAVAARLGIPPSGGLGAVLVKETPIAEALVFPPDENGETNHLQVLPAGPPPPNPSELLGSRRMHELIADLSERCDILVIDSTPTLAVSDSMPLLRLVSGVLVVARVNQTTREAAARLREVVDYAGGCPLGVVSTGTPSGGLYVAHGYGYKGKYDYPEDGSGGWRRRRQAGDMFDNQARSEAERPTLAEP